MPEKLILAEDVAAKNKAEDAFIAAVVSVNRAEKKTEFMRNLNLGRLHIQYKRRAKSNLWGRFGGGWNWALGFQLGGSTLIVNLLIASLRFDWKSNKG